MLTNKNNTVIYTGVTNNLIRRINEHKNKLIEGFSAKYNLIKYNLIKLVYYEITENIESAILREKQIKGGSRNKKIALIEKNNPNWIDLYETLI